MRRFSLGLLAVLCCLALVVPALAEVSFLPELSRMNWSLIPLELTLSAEVTAYAPFSEDRLPQLTSLIKHISLNLTYQPLIDLTQKTISVLVDGEDTLSLTLQESETGSMVQFSALPNASYTGDDPLHDLLGTSSEPITIFGIDGSETEWLEDGYVLLNALGTVLAPYQTDDKSVKTEIKNMGTARRKQDYTIPKDEAYQLSALLVEACPYGRLKDLISNLVFSGKQTVMIYRAEDDSPIRLEWSGRCGIDDDHVRNVAMTWRLRRDDTAYRDELTIAAPAINGSDNTKLSWTCNIAPDKKGIMTLDGKLSYDVAENKEKTSYTGEYKLTATPEDEGTRIKGSATLSRRLPDDSSAFGYTIEPDLLLSGENASPALNGTVTVSSLYNKKILSSAVITLGLRRTDFTGWQLRDETVALSELDETALAQTRKQVTTAISAAMIRRLLQLPREDLDYLLLELPEISVQKIINAAQSH